MPNQLQLKWRAPKAIEKKEKLFFDKKEEQVRKSAFGNAIDKVAELVEIDDKGWIRLSSGALHKTGYVTFCLPTAKTGTRTAEITKCEVRDGQPWVKISTVPSLPKKRMLGSRIVHS